MAQGEFRQWFGWLILFNRIVLKQIKEAHDLTALEYHVLTACFMAAVKQGDFSLARKVVKYMPNTNPSNFYRSLKILVNRGLLERSIKTTKTGANLYQYAITGKGHFIIKDFDRRMKLQINLIKSTRVK